MRKTQLSAFFLGHRKVYSGPTAKIAGKLSPKAIFLAVFFIMCCRISFAQEFSAQITTKSGAGNSMPGNFYFSKDKSRLEISKTITISRLDKKLGWLVFPDQKMFMEVPLELQNTPVSSDKMPEEIKRILLGEEKIDGKLVEKYEITVQQEGVPEKRYAWITKDEPKIMIKSCAVDGSWQIEYTNVVFGKQPDSLFEVPSDFQLFDYGQDSDGIIVNEE
jgi:hypothetical protein